MQIIMVDGTDEDIEGLVFFRTGTRFKSGIDT